MANPNFIKGHQAWNKGKIMNYSPEIIGKMRQSILKWRNSKIWQVKCPRCGVIVKARTPRPKKCIECQKYRIRKSRAGKKEYRVRKKRIIKSSKYSQWQKSRIQTIERDKGKCQICETLVGNSIDVHHIDGNGYCNSKNPNQLLDNLICLCHKCHKTITTILWIIEKYPQKIDLIKKLIFRGLN